MNVSTHNKQCHCSDLKQKLTVFSEYMFLFETYQNEVWMQKCGKKVFFLNIDILWVASWEILQKFLSKFILFKINNLKNDFPKKKCLNCTI